MLPDTTTTDSRASALLDLLQEPACLVNDEGVVVHLNDGWRNYAGFAETKDGRRTLEQLMGTHAGGVARTRLQSAARTGARTDFECQLKVKRGGGRWFVFKLQPLEKDSSGRRRWLCVGTDVDELKRRTLDLESRTAMQAEMLNVSVDCIKLIARDGTLVHMNKAGCRALGVPEDSSFGMPWLPLLPEEVRKKGEAALARAREGKFARFPGCSEVPGQSVQYWDNMLTPVAHEGGHPTAILCVSREVTAERHALESLKESRERLSIAAHVGGFGVWDYDIRHDKLQCDETWYRIMGRDLQNPVCSVAEFRPLIHPDDVDRATEINRTAEELMVAGRDYAIEFRIVRPYGEIRWVRSTACLIQDDRGTPTRAVGFVVDITDHRLAEQKLRESYEALRQAEKLARVGHWTWDIEKDTAVWSEMLYEIFGLDPSQVAPRLAELAKIFAPESFETFVQVAEECVTAGTCYSVDLEGIRADGERCFVNAKGEPVRDASGRIVQVRGTLADITERKNTENRIRALSERIQLAVEAGGVGIWEMNAATQRFIWDERMHALYGLKPGEFGGGLDEWSHWIHPDDRENVLTSWRNALAKDLVFNAELRIVHPTGQTRFLRAQAQIFRNPDGSLLRVIGTNWDITPAREAEEKLRGERHLLRTLIDHLPEVVFITDREDRVQVANPALLSSLKMPANAELCGEKLHSYLPPEIGEQLWRETVEVMESGIPLLNHVEKIVLPGGELKWVRTSKIPRRDTHGRVIGVICFSADITAERLAQDKIKQQAKLLAAANSQLQIALTEAERQAQRAQASERAKAEFLAVMSHEIRTPMNSVLGMVRLALQTSLSSQQENYLRKVDLSAKALIAIINDILDFSKIEAGGMTLESAEFSIESLLESVSAVTALRAGEKGVELVFSVAPDVPPQVIGDSLRLGQVLINLVNNAVKFTAKGEVVVSVRSEPSAKAGSVVLSFSVRDTGIGLSSEQIKKLFRPFAQADVDTSRKFGGTGLGLVICKSLVEMMGGGIHVESEPGRGSTFSFNVCVDVPLRASVALTEGKNSLAGRRVLIVDDNASARRVFSDSARRFGAQVTTAGSARESLQMLAEAGESAAPFELVLMDWGMPGMDGLACAREIKADARFRHTPVVLVVTAEAQEEVLHEAEELRLEAVLMKPAIESVLVATLGEALGQAHGSRGPWEKRKIQDTSRLHGLRALVADDGALNREVLVGFLRKLGLSAEAVEDGSAVLERLRENADFDYVLLDIEMSGLNGLETARIVREERRFKHLPIVALTGHVDAEARRATREAGMDGHIAKPIDMDVLQEELLRLRPAIPGREMLAGRRALVVDDHGLNRDLTGDLLAAVGMEVTFASNGREALERLEGGLFDLVLMDLQMPEMDGVETTLAIRGRPGWANLPVIALTAQAQSTDRNASLIAGVNAHLTKPVDEALLYRTIRECLVAAAERTSEINERPADYPAALPGVDLDIAFSLLGESYDIVLMYLRGFVRDFHSAPETLERDLAEGNIEELGKLGHLVKSVAAYLGAQELADAAARVEQAGRENRKDQMPGYVAEFQRQLKIVYDGIVAHFSSTRPENPKGESR